MRFLSAFFGVLLLAAPSLHAEEPAFTHGVAMHGAPKYGPDFTHFDYVNPKAVKGGKVTLGALGSFDSFNPFILKGTPPAGIGQLFETLTASSADEPFSQYGLLAEAVRMPEDRSWVEFKLNPAARFHNGTTVTPEDVVFSFETLTSKGHPFYRSYYAGVERAEKTGEKIVRFTFKEGTENRELPLTIGQLQVFPAHDYESRAFDESSLTIPVGSGPYKVKDYEPGRHITYERDPTYWGKDLPVKIGLNNFDTIRYDYYRDTTVALEAFKAGAIDFRIETESKKWATAYDVPEEKKDKLIKQTFAHGLPSGMQGFVFNTRRPIFKDAKTRAALAHAFDFTWANKTLFYSQYIRTKSYFDNSDMAADEALPTKDELALLEPLKADLPKEVFTDIYAPPSTAGKGGLRGNLKKALTLLQEAGWTVNDDGVMVDKDGTPFTFEIMLNAASAAAWERITLPFAKNLKRLGITATVRSVDVNQYKNRSDSFDFDMVVDVFGQSLSPGNEQRGFWGSVAADQDGSRNMAGIKSEAIDALIGAIIAAPDREALTTACRALDRALLWGHYVIPHWHIPYTRAAYWDKFSVPESTPMQGMQFDSWSRRDME